MKLSSGRRRQIANAARNRREIIAAQLSRRDMMRLGLLTAGGMLVAKGGLSARAADLADTGGNPVSPPTTPFVVPLPIMPLAQSVAPKTLGPAPTIAPNVAGGEGRTRDHQRFKEFAPKTYFETREREGQHSFHPDLPTQTIWGYNGIFPGPTYHAKTGTPCLVRLRNQLPPLNQPPVGGFGRADTSCHLHNGHTPSESDGFPTDFFAPGQFYDLHYPNIRAGNDERETMNTLWYHDHRLDFTSQNVYKGLAGFFLLFDEQDTGNETDGGAAFGLPSGDCDVPMLFADKIFDEDGNAFFDLFNLDGIIGDKFTVNGAIQPFFQVHPRKYRLRWLNSGPSRFYELFLTDLDNPTQVLPFTQISNDGNLLPAPVPVRSVRLSVAERCDVIVDFSQWKPGSRVYLENRLEQVNGRGPTDRVKPAGTGDLLLRFDVVLPKVKDASRVPKAFRPLPTIDLNKVVQTRTWKFERRNGAWVINGNFFDLDQVRASPKQGTSEIWVFQNASAGWQHPIHVHFEEFQILSRNGQPPPPNEVARKDVVRLGFNEEIRVLFKFRDFLGRYPMHCHNVVHEDHAMMLRFDIVP